MLDVSFTLTGIIFDVAPRVPAIPVERSCWNEPTTSNGTASRLHRRETERVEQRCELLQSSLRRAGNEKRRLDMHQRWRAARLKWACAQQRLGQKQLMQGYAVGEFLKLA